MCCCSGAKKAVRKWVCKSFFRFLRRMVSGPFLVLKSDVWVRVGNTNNSTVLDFFKTFCKMFSCFFVFSDKKIMPKVTFWHQKLCSKILKPSFENLKSQNGSWGSETILDRKIWFFYTWSFFCESLRLQNRFQTANLHFGAPGFRFCYLSVFSLKCSIPLTRMSFSVMFFIVSC